MSDMSSVARNSLDRLKIEIDQMMRGGDHQNPKPHKLVMLLAVLDLADQGLLSENKIYFDEILTRSFRNYFNLVRQSGDWCQPAPPYFHLRSSDFWNHKIKPGREYHYAKLKTSGGGKKRILDNIEYAYLSNCAFAVISDPESRQQLRAFINELLNHYTKKNNYHHLESMADLKWEKTD